MEFRCPYCAFAIVAKSARVGQFAARCPKCQKKFALIVPEGEGATPIVKTMAQPAATIAAPGAAPAASPKPAAAAPVAPTVGPAARPKPAAATVPPSPARPATANAPPRAAVTKPEAVPPPRTTNPAPGAAAATASPAMSSAVAPTRIDTARPGRAVPPEGKHVAPPVAVEDEPMPSALGGYQIVKKLGQGGMGSVYLARQMSLDRNVAVKVLSPALSEDAGFVARFTREAYAAAQLTHHNVVQVYDIGEDVGRHFYSMEFVEGESLAGLVARDGKLDPEAAVGYTLQAARGLKFAHDQGLIHRDVKPDNLLLNAQGIVKVADLGLVKKRGLSDVPRGISAGGNPAGGKATSKLEQAQSLNSTGFAMSMGTPAYMAPEQARDATRVDGRADIYSLGCTLYDLLTGRPPFSGKTAMELMTKHAAEPVTPPEMVAKRVPKELSGVLLKMVAKKPEDRHQNMGDCIRDLEDFMGAGSSGPFKPKEQHAAALEQAAKAFNESALARAAKYLVPGFFIACAVLAVLAALFGSSLSARVLWSGAYIALAATTVLAYVVLTGITRRNIVFLKLRQYVFGARIADWLKMIVTAAVLCLLLYVFNLLPTLIVVCIIACGLAAGFVFGLELLRDRQRKIHVDQIQEMLRTMRLRGLDEDALRQFICRYAGDHWEEFYEALFGYEAKIDARRSWGVSLRGKARPKFAAWRDALVAWVDARVAARKQARERRILERIEEKRLKAEGMDLLAARKAAQKQADKMVHKAEMLKQTLADARSESDRRNAATAGPARVTVIRSGSLLDTDDSGEDEQRGDWKRQSQLHRRHGGLLGLVLGPVVRFPVALVLLAVFFLWFHKVNPDFPQNAGTLARQAIDQQQNQLSDSGVANPLERAATPGHTSANVEINRNDVELPGIPHAIRHQLSGYPVGMAGLLLLISCLFRGWKVGLMTIAGAAVMVIGSRWIPGLAGVSAATLSATLGALLCVTGVLFGRNS